MGENRLQIVDLIVANTKISISELSEKLGISQTAIENNLRWLTSKNIIRRVGPDRGGYWEMVE